MNLSQTKDSIENASEFFDLEKLKEEFHMDERPAKNDKITLGIICLYTCWEAAATSMVNPLIPSEAQRHGVDQMTIGMLFFAFSLASLVTSLLLGQVQSTIGRRNIILLSFSLKVINYIGFILISTVNSQMLFIMVFAILHITQGISGSSYRTAVYSSLTSMFPDKINYVISLFETSAGIGFSFGPAIGSTLFFYGGYQLPFLVFLVILVSLTLLINVLLPSHLNQSESAGSASSDVSYLSVMKNRRILFACIIYGMNAVTYDFLNPILSDVMNMFYGITEDTVGWMFCLMGMGYVLSCQLTNVSLNYISNRRCVAISLFWNGFFMLMLGPSNLLKTSPHFVLTCIGLFFWGFTSAHFVVPAYTEIIDPGRHELGIDEGTINDLASGLSTTMYFVGQMLAYTVGGFVYKTSGFSHTIDMTVMIVFSVAILYFIWWDKLTFGTKDYTEEDFPKSEVDQEPSFKQPLMESFI